MSDLKDYPASAFLSGTLAACAFVTFPLIAVLTGTLLAALGAIGFRSFDLLAVGRFIFAAGVYAPVSMLFSWFGAALLGVLAWATLMFWRNAARRAEALLVICLITMLHCYRFARPVAGDDVFFWIRALIAAAVPIGAYFCIRRLRVSRARRLAQLDEDEDGIDDNPRHREGRQ